MAPKLNSMKKLCKISKIRLKLSQQLLKIFENARGAMSSIEQGYVQEFIEVNEFAEALDNIAACLLKKQVDIPIELLRMIKELSEWIKTENTPLIKKILNKY